MSEADGVRLAPCLTDIVEVVALRSPASALGTLASHRGLPLPATGRAHALNRQLTVCVRPDRWLILSAPQSPGEAAHVLQAECAEVAVVIDLSSGLEALHLLGPATREVLVRGCRIDLDPAAFPPGHAAATIVAQVSVIVIALSSGVLLLTPSTTARHFREWLAHTARPFGLEARPAVSISSLCGDALS